LFFDVSLEFWYMLPISIVIATIAMTAGVEGATFFTPLFILVLGLPPEIAIGTGLITEVFGFGSGLYAYARKRLIDYKLSFALLMVTIPMAIFGTWVAGYISPDILKTILGMGLLALAVTFLKTPESQKVVQLDTEIEAEFSEKKAETCVITNEGEQICYTVCNRAEGMAISGIGGMFIGMISTGLGELNGYFLLQRCKVPSKVAVATSVFVVALTALVASTGHFIRFVESGGETLETVMSLVIFTVPGVIIGGQIGPLIASRISQHTLERGLGILFVFVAVLMLGNVIL